MHRLALSLLAVVALAGPAAAQGFQAGRLAATRDSFDVIYQNRTIGTVVVALTRRADDYTLVSAARLPGMGLTQMDSVVFSAVSLSPSFIASSQATNAQRSTSRLTIAGGRARGTARRANGSADTTDTIDVAMPPGLVADGMEMVLLPTLDLSDGLTLSYETFDGRTGTPRSYALEVLGREPVSVPAGTFDAWRVQLGGDQSELVWVTTTYPRRIVMVRLEDAQMELRLATPVR